MLAGEKGKDIVQISVGCQWKSWEAQKRLTMMLEDLSSKRNILSSLQEKRLLSQETKYKLRSHLLAFLLQVDQNKWGARSVHNCPAGQLWDWKGFQDPDTEKPNALWAVAFLAARDELRLVREWWHSQPKDACVMTGHRNSCDTQIPQL